MYINTGLLPPLRFRHFYRLCNYTAPENEIKIYSFPKYHRFREEVVTKLEKVGHVFEFFEVHCETLLLYVKNGEVFVL